MKNETSLYGAIALFTVAASSVFSYIWSAFGIAACGYVALALGVVFVCAVVAAFNQTERRMRAAVAKADITHPDLRKAA